MKLATKPYSSFVSDSEGVVCTHFRLKYKGVWTSLCFVQEEVVSQEKPSSLVSYGFYSMLVPLCGRLPMICFWALPISFMGTCIPMRGSNPPPTVYPLPAHPSTISGFHPTAFWQIALVIDDGTKYKNIGFLHICAFFLDTIDDFCIQNIKPE